MKNTLLAAAALAICGGQAYADYVDPDSTGFTFTDVKVVATTPVKDQNRSGTCWSFSGLSFMEDEILRKTGREVDLSEMFVVRHCYRDKAERYVRLYGKGCFASGGGFAEIPYVWGRYGMVPEEAFAGLEYGEEKHDHYELDAALRAYTEAIVKKEGKRLSTAWLRGIDGILDAYMGQLPETFTVDGKTYTPESYARSLGVDMSDYVSLTSFTHHPFYQPFAVEVPDNWMGALSQNLPLDELKAVVDNAIDNGYSVAWAADVSEPGFQWYKGYAVMPKLKGSEGKEGSELARWVHLSDKDREKEAYELSGPTEEIEVTQEVRQQMFDRQETTDDHGMVIVGKAVDQEGNRYYKVKNSWDTNQIYDGFFYVSEPYFLAKTIYVMVNGEAIPKAIAAKIKK